MDVNTAAAHYKQCHILGLQRCHLPHAWTS